MDKPLTFFEQVNEFKRKLVFEAMDQALGNVKACSEILGVSLPTMYRLIRETVPKEGGRYSKRPSLRERFTREELEWGLACLSPDGVKYWIKDISWQSGMLTITSTSKTRSLQIEEFLRLYEKA